MEEKSSKSYEELTLESILASSNSDEIESSIQEEDSVVKDILLSRREEEGRVELPDGADMLEDFIEYKGYELRDSQFEIVDEALEEFFTAVEADEDGDHEDGMENGVNIQINAPVATGKSAAGIFIGLGCSQRTVLASSNKSLQEQYINKDVPEIAQFLKDTYDFDLSYSIMKGQYNYANLKNLKSVLDGTSEIDAFQEITDEELEIITEIVNLSEEGIKEVAETGRYSNKLDTGELIACLPKEMQRHASAASPGGFGSGFGQWVTKLIPGHSLGEDHSADEISEFYDTCRSRSKEGDHSLFVDEESPYMTAYWLAATSDVCIINQNLLIADLNRFQRQYTNPESHFVPSIVRGAGMIIVDEAQHYPAIITSSMAKEFSLNSYSKTLERILNRLAKNGAEKMPIYDAYESFKKKVDECHDKIRESAVEDYDGQVEVDPDLVVELLNDLKIYTFTFNQKRVSGTKSSLIRIANEKAKNNLINDGQNKEKDKISKVFNKCFAECNSNIIEPLMEFFSDEAWSVTAKRTFKTRNDEVPNYIVSLVPLDITGHRAEVLFAQLQPNVISTAMSDLDWQGVFGTGMILMSGTLSKNVGPKIGMEKDYSVYISVTSPMDESRVRYCIPDDLPEPSGRTYMDWQKQASSRVIDAVKAAKGRTMILCTSNSTMNEFASALRKKVPSVRVIVQNEMDKAEAIATFKSEKNAILIGVKSFWEGVDIPGDDLILVIMDKIMFPIKDDPIYGALVDAEAERPNGNPFMNVLVDHAAFMFAQGAGRLQRAESDMGGILVLDPRLLTTRYGSRVVSLAPEKAPLTSDYGRFKRYLKNLVDHIDNGEKEPSKVSLTKDPNNWIKLSKIGIKGSNRNSKKSVKSNSGQRRF